VGVGGVVEGAAERGIGPLIGLNSLIHYNGFLNKNNMNNKAASSRGKNQNYGHGGSVKIDGSLISF
jgi:hypothetical protein